MQSNERGDGLQYQKRRFPRSESVRVPDARSTPLSVAKINQSLLAERVSSLQSPSGSK